MDENMSMIYFLENMSARASPFFVIGNNIYFHHNSANTIKRLRLRRVSSVFTRNYGISRRKRLFTQ